MRRAGVHGTFNIAIPNISYGLKNQMKYVILNVSIAISRKHEGIFQIATWKFILLITWLAYRGYLIACIRGGVKGVSTGTSRSDFKSN